MTRHAPREDRDALLARLEGALRKVGAHAVLVSDLVAARVGLNATDLKCLDLLHLGGVTTAGALARHTGLTTGATTAVIDRLERAGFVRRRHDPADWRRVLVEVVPSSAGRIAPLYAPLASRFAELNRLYGDGQLAVVADYLSRALDVLAGHVSWLQTQPAPRARRAARRAALPGSAPGRPWPRRADGRPAGRAGAADRH